MAARSPLALVASCAVFTACFTPNIQDEDTDAMAGTETAADTDPATTSETMTTAPGMTTTPGTTAAPTTGSPTTGAPTTTTADPTVTTADTGDETSDGPAPGCGDGRVADDEECDEGEANGGAGCTELCTVPFCGDEIVSGDEACDDGDANGMELGDCAPDCSTTVEARAITMAFDYSQNGDLGGPGMSVAYVDARCESSGAVGYKALFADGTDRRATVSPNVGDGQIDWVLRPWTRYIRDDGELVWVTDASALLGVRDGQPMDLINPINGTSYTSNSITGMRKNWIAHTLTNCNEWSSSSEGAHRPQGDPQSAEAGEFLDDEVGVGPNCASYGLSICVEQ